MSDIFIIYPETWSDPPTKALPGAIPTCPECAEFYPDFWDGETTWMSLGVALNTMYVCSRCGYVFGKARRVE